ncbi:MAG: histone deacetylase [Elusimicrobia bacterium]|nr:histone deacetylase [Elusimicrobiota bacterium]
MPAVFTDPSTTGYHTPGHPEAPFRVAKSADRLKAAGHRLLAPERPGDDAAILRVHTQRHIDSVRSGDYQDADTPHYTRIDAIARTSLAGALSASARALAGEPAFSLMRPPGHHAARERVAGFCYFNNLAIACSEFADKRVAIVDVDVHHGDGTEDWAFGKENVSFVSLHQAPLYPGTGLQTRGNCRNVPLEPGTGEARYLKALEQAIEGTLSFKPELLAVSAGFDTYKECPLAQLRLEKGTYKRLGRLLAETKLKRFAVLEGGYADDLPLLIENFLDGFFG